RGGDKEVFDNYSFVCATAKRINNKEERIKNKQGVRFADIFQNISPQGNVLQSKTFFLSAFADKTRYLDYYFLFILSSFFF
ncbi:MAG: hypothetical protein IJ696_08900, partial [Ruminococcus sp.]|nr:hypothetical protein [Ruminococcus sp.]